MTRDEFLADLRPALRRSAAWRSKQAENFPADRRNQVAARTLESLARSAPRDLSADIWADLAPFFEAGGNYQTPAWNLAVTETARMIGFRSHPEDINAFLDGLLTRLTAGSVAA